MHRAVVLRRLEVDRVRRTRHRAETAGHALLEPVLVPHQHLLAAVLREHRNLLVRVVHRDLRLEHVPEGGREAREAADESSSDHIGIPTPNSQVPNPEQASVSGPWELAIWDVGIRSRAYNGPVLQEPRFLSAEQFLLTTLIVKLAVMAVLATMLARYRRFRHILIFERRGWLDRLVFTLAHRRAADGRRRRSRLLLNYNAADLTLEGAFLAGLIAGPYAGALVGVLVGIPAARSPASSSRCRLPSAAALPAAACAKRARRKRSGSSRRSSSSTCTSTSGTMVRKLETQLAARAAARAGRARAAPPGARRALRRGPAVLSSGLGTSPLDDGARRARHGARRRHADQDLEQRAHRAPAAGAGKAAARREDRGAQEPDQPALPLQHARRRSRR